MIESIFTWEILKNLAVQCVSWGLILYMIRDNFIFNKYVVIGAYFTFDIVVHLLRILTGEPILQGVYIVIYYTYFFLVKENRLNSISGGIICLCMMNIISNAILWIIFMGISIYRGDGAWLDIADEDPHMYLLMAEVMIVSGIITVFFGRWIRDYVLSLTGVNRRILFFVGPVLFIANTFVKNACDGSYFTSPHGIALVADVCMIVISSICILCITYGMLKEKKKVNEEITRRMDALQKEYEEVAKEEQRLRIIRHELKNHIVEAEDCRDGH